MFFGIPEWALGVTAILAVVSVLKVVTTRLMPPGYRQRSWRGDLIPPETEDTQARLAELDELKRRVAELEERVDFTERPLRDSEHRQALLTGALEVSS